MKICKTCVQPDTRPGIIFQDGICGGCLWEEQKKKIDWDTREKELVSWVDWAKKEAKLRGTNYDCVLGVSGGKDSTYCSLKAKSLGLRCLLVNSEPEGITDIGRKNIENLKRQGFDVISMRPNPQVMKKLVKKDFYEFLNPVKVTEFSLWSSAYIIAEKFNIPLMIQGENPALTLGVAAVVSKDDNALNADMQDTLRSGWERYIGNGITEKDLYLFHYNRNINTKAIWMNYYDKDWSPYRNMQFSVAHGLTVKSTAEGTGTFENFFQMDSDLVQVNQMLKYYKFGFGQATDHACYAIREGRMTREEGIKLVKEHDGKCAPEYIKKFCDYIEISVDEFWDVVARFTNKELFQWETNTWIPKWSLLK